MKHAPTDGSLQRDHTGLSFGRTLAHQRLGAPTTIVSPDSEVNLTKNAFNGEKIVVHYILAESYGQVIEALSAILAPILNPASEAAVFGTNAARFYKIV